MGRSKFKDERHDEGRVRVIWDRFDTYRDVRALVRGRRVGPRWVAFFDREQGILPTVPRITGSCVVEAWPRGQAANLATMALSVDPDDRRAAQAIVSTRAGGTSIDPARDCFVYFLSEPSDELTRGLGGVVPLGKYVPSAGHANWAVAWESLADAVSCNDLRRRTSEAEGVDDES